MDLCIELLITISSGLAYRQVAQNTKHYTCINLLLHALQMQSSKFRPFVSPDKLCF